MQRHRYVSIVSFIIAAGFFSWGFILAGPESSQEIGEGVGLPMFMLAASVGIVSLALIFFRREVLLTWLKFSIPGLLLGTLWVYLAPINCTSGILSYGDCFNKEIVSWVTSVVFFAISIIIIVVKSIKLRNKNL